MQAGPSVTLVSSDTATQGSWVGTTYGTAGYKVFGDSSSYPSYATVSASGQSAWTWISSSSDVQALQKASNHSDRIAAIWCSSGTMDITIHVIGDARQVALYLLDMDNLGRAETIDAYDAVSGAPLLSQQTLTSFSNGKYVVLNQNGNFRLRFTNVAGANVNAVGFAQIDAAWLKVQGGVTNAGFTWIRGDYTYDGQITAADFTAITQALATPSALAPGSLSAPAALAAVPAATTTTTTASATPAVAAAPPAPATSTAPSALTASVVSAAVAAVEPAATHPIPPAALMPPRAPHALLTSAMDQGLSAGSISAAAKRRGLTILSRPLRSLTTVFGASAPRQ